jgi:uncharacterized OsmC-like protein
MKMFASVKNSFQSHETVVGTEGNVKTVKLEPKADGFGSSVNGGELLLLSLATCFCNDVYREAKKTNMKIDTVEVIVSGKFGGEGEPAKSISYEVKVEASNHSKEEISELTRRVDRIAEIHNTLRKGIEVNLKFE